jgi:hypothetical protein
MMDSAVLSTPGRNLVIVAAGDKSLHLEYARTYREFDLWVIYYGSDSEVQKMYAASAERLIAAKGMKLELIRKVFVEGVLFDRSHDLSRYQYIMFPDDDIHFPNGAQSINYLFQTAEMLRADIFQAAIANQNFSWQCTLQIPGAYCHRVNMAEVMMPGFSYEALIKGFLPAIHTMNFMKSGWGIEAITQRLAEAELRRPVRTFVLDCVPVIHTRPPGTNTAVRDAGRAELAFIPQFMMDPPKTTRIYQSREEALMDLY